jgi:hypothetical protein
MTNGQAALYKMPEFCQGDRVQIESLRPAATIDQLTVGQATIFQFPEII